MTVTHELSIEDIESLDPLFKSVSLAMLHPDWVVSTYENRGKLISFQIYAGAKLLATMKSTLNFYTISTVSGDPHFMQLAWRILNWALADLRPTGWNGMEGILRMPTAEAQRTWLDRVLLYAQLEGLTA